MCSERLARPGIDRTAVVVPPSTPQRLHGWIFLARLELGGARNCPLAGLTNLISSINLYYYQVSHYRRHRVIIVQDRSAYRVGCSVSNDGLHQQGEAIDWPHEKKHMTCYPLTDSYQYHNDNITHVADMQSGQNLRTAACRRLRVDSFNPTECFGAFHCINVEAWCMLVPVFLRDARDLQEQ